MAEQHAIASAAESKGMLATIASLRDLIQRGAIANDEASEIGSDVAAALQDAGIFDMMVPRALGGGEADPQTLIDVIRELSRLDGSVGWYAGAAMVGGAVAGGFLGERAVDAIFCSGGKSTCAGQAAPLGKAERVGDGYRISGTFSFGSGSPSAQWFVGGYILHADGAPVLQDNGHPVFLLAFAPREKVEMLGNWDVLGLRGTGSYDYRVLEQVVHEDFTLNAAAPIAQRGGTLYRMGFLALPAIAHGSFALGAGRRALDEWATYARTKKRPPAGFVNEQESVQRDLALANGELRAADAYMHGTFAAISAAAEGGTVPPELQLDGRLCASHAMATGARVSQRAFTACATTALRDGNALQRAYRDLQAGMAHIFTGEQSMIELGRVLAGIPGAAVAF